jgi:hypothetical protein
MTLGFKSRNLKAGEGRGPLSLERIRRTLGIPGSRETGFIESIPFSLYDATSGSETELQVAVCGDKKSVDLPLTIEKSNYFANILLARIRSGNKQ